MPTTFNVATTADTLGGAALSVRDAIRAANVDSSPGDHVINLPAGSYTLAIGNSAGQENAAAQGDLDILVSRRLVIQGAGTSGGSLTRVDGGGLDRVFHLQPAAGVEVVFRDFLISGGLARDQGSAGLMPGQSDSAGGGILVTSGSLRLENVVVEVNAAVGARGLDSPGSGPAGNGYAARGGGIFALSGPLTLVNSTVRSNYAVGGDGGSGGITPQNIAGRGGFGGQAFGGGVFAINGLAVRLDNSTLADNRAAGGQGGPGGISASDSELGSVGGHGGYGGQAWGGGLYADAGSLTLDGGALERNRAEGGAGNTGGHGGRFPVFAFVGGQQQLVGYLGTLGAVGGNAGSAFGGGATPTARRFMILSSGFWVTCLLPRQISTTALYQLTPAD